MQLTKLTIFFTYFLLLASIVNGEKKLNDKEKFLSINPNITNEALRSELENLMEEFGVEKQRVRIFYDEKIIALKAERLKKIQSIKKDFGERREVLFIKYGEDRKKLKSTILPNIKKRGKDKKRILKSK